jgi:hypothetical protein
MKKPSLSAVLLLALASAALFRPAARAQVDTSAPIIVKQSKPSPVWIKGQVIRADGHSIVISELGNQRAVHTFTYSGKSLDKMAKILNEGGYQVGDKVRILYQPGDTVAIDVRGKPSKSP